MTAASCPERWHYYNESCFYVSLTKTDQPSARSECLAMGGDLASISDQAEYDFVISISLELAIFVYIFVNIIKHTPHKLSGYLAFESVVPVLKSHVMFSACQNP